MTTFDGVRAVTESEPFRAPAVAGAASATARLPALAGFALASPASMLRFNASIRLTTLLTTPWWNLTFGH